MGKLALATALVGYLSVPAHSSALDRICDGGVDLAVGQWARYLTDVPFQAEKKERRLAIIGTETVDGKDHYWIEVDAPQATGSMIFQFLIPSYPYEGDAVRKVIAKMSPALPAMEYPGEMVGSLQDQDNLSHPIREACNEEEAVPESVTVPAGTFQTQRIRLRRLAKDIWISPEVPFGVVKLADSEGKGLELVEHGTGAASSITETPQKMPGSP